MEIGGRKSYRLELGPFTVFFQEIEKIFEINEKSEKN
jgi:hypothetical protein